MRTLKNSSIAPNSISERFWNKVSKSEVGCWKWTASSRAGYAQFSIKPGLTLKAYRVAWELTHGDLPDDKQVLHCCDNPLCVNPAHLFLGTISDNLRDCWKKARRKYPFKRGEGHPNARLSDYEVLKIRNFYSTRAITQREVAKQFKISQSWVSKIVSLRQRNDIIINDAYIGP